MLVLGRTDYYCYYYCVPEVVDCFLQPFLESHARLPVQRALGEADIRPALLGVVLEKTTKGTPPPRAGRVRNHEDVLLILFLANTRKL